MPRFVLSLLVMILLCGSVLAQSPFQNQSELANRIEFKEAFYRKMIAGAMLVSENQKKYDVAYYQLNLDLNPVTEVLSGRVVVAAEVTGNSLEYVDLNLLNNMTVSSVTGDLQTLTFTHQNNILKIILPAVLSFGEKFSLEITYSGTPGQSGLGAFGFDSYQGKPMIWSLSEPYGARNWWPCKDFPTDKADSVDINVTVPSNLVVASNGTLAKVETTGTQKTYFWQERYPITTYLVSIAAYPYKVYSDWFRYSERDSMEIQFYVFPDHYQSSFPNYAKTKKMLQAFSELYGLYPFINEKYGHAEFLWGGGMEHQTITSLGGWGESLIAHELSHMWWGDMITCDSFHHIWLNEGFARYSEALWREYNDGPVALHQNMSYYKYFGAGTIYVEDPEREDVFHTGLTYNKASWVLHMLRHVIGEEKFRELLLTYGSDARYRMGTANTEQFQKVVEDLTGKDLDAFFYQWIYQEGFPVYAYSWRARTTDSGQYRVTGGISQEQTLGPIFKMPVDLTLRSATRETTVVVEVNQALTNFAVIADFLPTEVILDKDDWILCRINEIREAQLSIISTEIDDAAGNNDHRLDPGEQAQITVELQNLGADLTNIQGTLTSNDPQVAVLSGQSAFVDADNGVFFSNATPFEVEVLNATLPHVAEFKLQTASDQGNRFTLYFYAEIGKSAILLVDDDAGANYERYFKGMAFQKQQNYNLWTVKTQGVPGDTLAAFDIVIWFTGNDSTTSLTSTEQQSLTAYLNQGGRLAISGAKIGQDLMADGSAGDSLFFFQYLRAKYLQANPGVTKLLGVGGDPVASGLTIHFDGVFSSARNQQSPGVIAPGEGAFPILSYLPARETAAVRYENPENDSRVVYFAFGLEGIAGPREDTAAILLYNTIKWLSGFTTAVDLLAENVTMPAAYRLQPNYPNPFNPETRLSFELPKNTRVSLKIFNSLGQEIRTLIAAWQPAGVHQVVWDGRNDLNQPVSSGIYFFQLQTPEFSQTQKMLLMR